jgi:lipoprotein signal peptidase
MAGIAVAVLAFDQLTKLAVLKLLGYSQERVVIDGFFKFVHWGNTGAAWSFFTQFSDSNQWLAVFALVALLALFATHHHFDSHTLLGQISLGLIFGGIAGNLARALPSGLGAVVDPAAWQRPPVFGWLADEGVTEDELRRVFNIGIGYCAVIPSGWRRSSCRSGSAGTSGRGSAASARGSRRSASRSSTPARPTSANAS